MKTASHSHSVFLTTRDPKVRSAIRFSLLLHLGLLIFAVTKNLFFPSTPVPYEAVLRVDVVDLPDMIKKDLQDAADSALSPPPPALPESAPRSQLEEAKEDEMVLKPEKIQPHSDDEKQKKIEKLKEAKKADDALKNALNRVKALNKIKTSDAQPLPEVIKGNRVSPGSSLSGDAKEATEASYYDLVRDRVKSRWALPPWLERQNLSATVRITLGPDGTLRSFIWIRSSGNTQFDQYVKQSIAESVPFPKPPDNLVSSLLGDGVSLGFPL